MRTGLSVRAGLSALGRLGSRSACLALLSGLSEEEDVFDCKGSTRGVGWGLFCLAGLAGCLSHDASNFNHTQCPALGRRKIVFRNFL